MEFRDKFFGKFFLRNAGREEQIEVYSKRLRSVEIMTIVMGILSVIYIVAAICSIGPNNVLISFWVPASISEWAAECATGNTEFAMIMAHVADICRVGLYAGFCWGFRSMVMRVMEMGFFLGYFYAKVFRVISKFFIILPLIGWFILALYDIGFQLMVYAAPFIYGALGVFACMPFWPLVALTEYILFSRKLSKLEKEPVVVINESVAEAAS